jgi:hypothetical protein
VFACAIDQGKHQDAWFPFIACVEGSFGPGIESILESCAEAANLDYEEIKDCATGGTLSTHHLHQSVQSFARFMLEQVLIYKGCMPLRESALRTALPVPGKGTRGDALEEAAAEETDSLVPGHQYVPWVVVNGAYSPSEYHQCIQVIVNSPGNSNAQHLVLFSDILPCH